MIASPNMAKTPPPPQYKRSESGFRIAESALAMVGATPLVRLARLSPDGGASVWGKAEFTNPGGSVKDRPALHMVLAAEREGTLSPGATMIEATSGNTGISLAMIAAVRGYRCVLVMPEDMSLERRYILRAYGAEIVLTPALDGMAGAVQRAAALLAETERGFMPSQFENPENPKSHETTTALELLEQAGPGLSAFVAGMGTGGTVTGTGRVLKRRDAKIRVIAVEPQSSAVLSGKSPGMHGIQGMGAGFVPAIVDRSVIDEIVTVSDVAAERMARRLAREEGLLVGPSSGANVHAAVEVAKTLPESARVATVLCDSGERYLF